MLIEYKVGMDAIDWPQLLSLYAEVDMLGGLAKKGDLPKIRVAFANSQKVVTAWARGRLVGAGRLVSDGVCYGNIFDVGVLPEYQMQGVGKGVMHQLMKGNDHLRFYAISGFRDQDFFRKLGFKRHKSAFARYPAETEYQEYFE